MQAGVIKQLGAKWLLVFYDHVCSHLDLAVNGFEEAGIVDELENGVITGNLKTRKRRNGNGNATKNRTLP